jgi:hemerythrin-like domain-containing protein
MKPPDMLKFEHRQIGRVLKSLLLMSNALRQGKEVGKLLNQEVDFLTHYLIFHQQKEEQVFFPALQEQLITMVEDPLAPLTAEHKKSNTLLQQVTKEIKELTVKKVKPETLATTIQQFVFSLIKHLRKENMLLHKLSAPRPPPNKKIQLPQRLQLFDQQHDLVAKQRYERLATNLYQESKKLAA